MNATLRKYLGLKSEPKPDLPWVKFEDVQGMFSVFNDEKWSSAMERLDFQEPKLVAMALQWTLKDTVLETPILDAGCGTGLVAPLVRKFSKRLEGVDLSPEMIDGAKKSGDYDALHCAEIVTFMESHEGYGAIVASSLCIFLSDLRPLFKAAHHALVSGGVFVFTADLHPGEEPVVVSPRHHAMTLHNPKKMLMGAWDAGLELVSYQQCRMRNDFFKLQPIEGAVAVLRKP